ncbi:MAG: T9SS type A sorting domain-containing protein [Ignavibacteriae bacterium]|nr:T9SS type A sorting domain-containing protein [Ignavibacteriota bacterium]
MYRCLLAIIFSLLLFTLDSNSQWEKANGGKELPDSTSIFSILTNGNSVIAGTKKGIYFSTNNGEDWVQKNNGLDAQVEITALGMKGNLYFVGTVDGIYASSDNGDNWTESDDGINIQTIYCFLVNGSNIFVGSTGGVFISTNNGKDWLQKNQGIPEDESIYALTLKGNTIFAGTSVGVYASSNNGTNWSKKNFSEIVTSIVTNKNELYLSGEGYYTGIKVSTDNGSSWLEENNGFDVSKTTKYYLLSAGDSVYLGAQGLGVYVTNNKGKNWTQFSDGLSAYVQGNELMLASNDKYIFVGSKGASGYCNLWRRDRNETHIGVNDENEISGEFIKVAPNPVKDILHIKVNIPSEQIISLSISDVLGNNKVITNNELNIGENNVISIPVDNYSPGTYYITLSTTSGTISKVISIY